MSKALIVLASCFLTSVVGATTYGDAPPIEAALRHAETVVAGYFSGASDTRQEVVKNVTNEQGEFRDLSVKYSSHEFRVVEVIDGDETPETIWINVRGALELPAAKERVVVGVTPDQGGSRGDYLVLYSRIMVTDSESDLERARKLSKKERASMVRTKQVTIDRYGEVEAARRTLPKAKVDDPHPEKQRTVPTSIETEAKNVTLSGTNRHPEEDE